ncbi:hypothetical protein DE146DRAFT_602236 [Phaeosphaeria sp. MPI-PUGE-AT-0046c]|nr:hypothetical protein DE146DRAFT_602236 [Phaeosphaeria sp. MPI-PUGE-AT-0046c]
MAAPPALEKKPVKFSNLLLGAGLNMVTTLGQPLEVVKTTMAANRSDGFSGAIGRIWSRGGVLGFYQGLIPWAWIEASTKGAVLLFVASEAEFHAKSFGANNFVAGISGGMVGGLAQAYATMGFCTCMKTVEITKHKVAASGVKPPGTMETFMNIYRQEGIRGINRGVNAVAVRQVTNWGSRFGLSRVAESGIRRVTGKEGGEKLSVMEKITASALGGGLSAWNQPIEVIRVEMQSKTVDPNRPKNLTVGKAFRYIYSNNGLSGLYRGVAPRIGLGVWQTVCMVALGDVAKEAVEKLTGDQYASSMKAWRCDLTALSQLHNLYFVACNDSILVHQPEFPDQNLSEPKFILQPPVSAPNLEPYIDDEDPHSITRILVDYLGNDEILLVTCDDGDVIGYRVEEIQRVLDLAQQSSDQGEDSDIAAHMRVFLHRNVGLSAWGLAVHREARIIAISANTHEITVLAFALASGGHAPHETGFLDAILDTDFPSPRRRDHIITLRASHNVPTVSFNNNDEDPGGRWLFATCITGEVTLWDLHNPKMPARALRMGWCLDAPLPSQAPPLTLGGCRCLGARGHPHATWDAMFLNPRSAHEVSSSECEWTSTDAEPFFDDAKVQKERFRSEDGDLWNAPTTVHHDTTDDTGSSDEMLILGGDSESSESGSDSGDDAMSSLFMPPDLPAAIERRLGPSAQPPAYSEIKTSPSPQNRQPCLIVSKDDIFLVQSPFNKVDDEPEYTLEKSRIAGDEPDHTLVMRRPLYPGPWRPNPVSYDRLCFSAQIPELGIFIVGSPLGRAAIFALTKSPNTKEGYKYGFQLEYVLPFNKDDEDEILDQGHSNRRMVGVAVGPVQGMLGRAGGGDRTWRVLMYFTDHKVLSYELKRKRAEGTPGLGDLVV